MRGKVLRLQPATMNAKRRWLLTSTLGVTLLLGAIGWTLEKDSGSRVALFQESKGIDPAERDRELTAFVERVEATTALEVTSVEVPSDPGQIVSSVEATPRVVGRVLDTLEQPVGEVGVALYLGRQKWVTTSDAHGAYEFSALPAGRYRLFVKPSSLPEGYLAPWKQSIPDTVGPRPTGIHGSSFLLPREGTRRVDLRVFRASGVTGALLGTHGEGIEGARLKLQSTLGVEHHLLSDSNGRYVSDRVYPGSYLALVESVPGIEAYEGMNPLPVAFQVGAGEHLELPTMRMTGEGHLIRGRVLDSRDMPIAGRAVEALGLLGDGLPLTWRAVSDEAGEFRIGRLPDLRVSLFLVDDGATPKGRELRETIDLASVDGDVELAEWRVELTSEFRVEGRVRVDPAWASEQDLDVYTLELRSDLSSASRVDPVWIDPDRGEFRWSCSTPQAAVELTVVLTTHRGVEHLRKLRLQPLANGLEELTVSFP